MVPSYLRKTSFSSEANIGFFFHSPFPSSGIFRMFQYRNELLSSILHCDLVGFHLFEYARNFLMTCHRLLGLEYEFSRGGYLGINNHGRNVMIRVSHVGIDEAYFDELFKSSAYRRPLRQLKAEIKEMRPEGEEPPMIITSIDSLHPITGIKNKLLSYYQFLKKYGDTYKRKVVLI
jgi:trehalose 6-phosphate synthase/phosphatase